MLPPLCALQYAFTLNPDRVVVKSLQPNMDIGYEIRNVNFYVCNVICEPTVTLNVEKRLMQSAACYPIYNWRTTTLNIPAGLITYAQEVILIYVFLHSRATICRISIKELSCFVSIRMFLPQVYCPT